MRLSLVFVSVLILAGCGTSKTNVTNSAEAAKYDPASTARVRIVAGSWVWAGYVTGQSCEQYFNVSRNSGIVPPPGWRLARHHEHEELNFFTTHWPSDYQNNVIGMPASSKTQAIDSTDGYYDELVVPAGQTFIAAVSFGAVRAHCYPAPASFVPQSGKDYEVRLDYSQSSYFAPTKCRVGVYELQPAGASSSAAAERPMPADYCVADPAGLYHTLSIKP